MPTVHHSSLKDQLGAATLVVALVLLLAITLMAFSGVKVGVNEQRISANEVRYREALEVAQAGMEHGIAYLRANKSIIASNAAGGWNAAASSPRWTACAGNDLPCGTSTSASYDSAYLAYRNVPNTAQVSSAYTYTLHFATPASGAAPVANPTITIISTASPATSGGVADPLAGSAQLKQTVKGYGLITHRPNRPLIAATTIKIGQGNHGGQVWPNLNFAPGVSPQSAWAGQTTGTPINIAVGAVTCNDSYPNCSSTISTSSTSGLDLSTANFPPDLFQYTFGVNASNYHIIKNDRSVTRLTTCGSLGSAGIYWITGDCEISGTVGSFSNPYVLIIEGTFDMEDDTTFYGIVFLTKADGANGSGGNTDLKEDITIYGALLSDSSVQLEADGQEISVIYHQNVIDIASSYGGGFAKLPGGWFDQLKP